MAHPVLGARLLACSEAVERVVGRSAHEILGSPDDLKLRSSMTLFAAAAPDRPVFAAVLGKYYDNLPDPVTTKLLAGV